MRYSRAFYIVLALTIAYVLVWTRKDPFVDAPQLPAGTMKQDISFPSESLGRTMTYRVIRPANIAPNQKLPVVWLLHGAGEDYRTWSNRSSMATLATHGVVLVMPDASNSYYINQANSAHGRYEDYLIHDVVSDVRKHFPNAATDPEHNAIVGVSRGGYGAFVLGLKHPGMFGFVGGISSALDLPQRTFHWKHPLDSYGIRQAFGPVGSETRQENDPFLLMTRFRGNPSIPFLYLGCGDQDPLTAVNARFAKRLATYPFSYTVETGTGQHDWQSWNLMLPDMKKSLLTYFNGKDPSEATP